MDVHAVPNANFTSLGGRSVHDRDDAAYREYRRRWEENPRNFVVGDFPIHLDLEASSRCNLRCTFCDKLPVLGPGDLGDMDFSLYTRMIDEGAEKGLKSLKLSYRGEPLMNSRLADMVARAKRLGILDVYFNTNAMLLTERTAQAFIDAGLDRISVSVEGTDKTAFERARLGARFETIIRNLERLIALRAKAGTEHPRIRVQTVRLPGLDFEEYGRFWSRFGDEAASVDYKDVEDRKLGVEAPSFACPQLWQRMTVEYDGTILGCNNDDFRKLSPGRAGTISLEAAWTHPLLETARAQHRQGRSHQVEACDGCPWRAAQMGKAM